MKLERSKNSARNILFGTVTRAFNLIVPFFMRTLIIYVLGVEYVGLDSLFISILQVLNLAELGVGYALVYSMYEPLAKDDTEKICALLLLYKKYYRIIGLVILGAGIILTPFLPLLIKGDVPDGINLYLLYYLNLLSTVVSYLFFSYKISIITLYQRNDIVDKVRLTTSAIKYTLQFLVLWLFHNYYFFIIVALSSEVLANYISYLMVNKYFPQYKAEGKLSKKEVSLINHRARDLFTAAFGSVVVDSADTIVISAFLGLTSLALFQNYYFVITTIIGVITLITNSALAGIGNSIVTETKEKNYSDMKKLTFVFCWIGVFSVCCLLCAVQPFVKIWVGKENLLPYSLVICFCVYLFVKIINSLLNTYKDAAGLWHIDRFRPLVTALSNLTMNLIMVQFWGLFGILISTIISMLFIGMPWLLYNLFSFLFTNKKIKEYLFVLLNYSIICVVLGIASALLISRIELNSIVFTIIVRITVCTCMNIAVLLIVFGKTSEFCSLIHYADKVTNGKFGFLFKRLGL